MDAEGEDPSGENHATAEDSRTGEGPGNGPAPEDEDAIGLAKQVRGEFDSLPTVTLRQMAATAGIDPVPRQRNA